MCGWGSWDGIEHIHMGPIDLEEFCCYWCFDVPQPPIWTTQHNTRHFLTYMKLLPSRLQEPELAALIGDFLAYPGLSD